MSPYKSVETFMGTTEQSSNFQTVDSLLFWSGFYGSIESLWPCNATLPATVQLGRRWVSECIAQLTIGVANCTTHKYNLLTYPQTVSGEPISEV